METSILQTDFDLLSMFPLIISRLWPLFLYLQLYFLQLNNYCTPIQLLYTNTIMVKYQNLRVLTNFYSHP